MRPEVKIGIIVGLAVIVGGVIFFFAHSKPGSSTAGALPMEAPARVVTPAGKSEAAHPRSPTPRPATPPRPGLTERAPTGGQKPLVPGPTEQAAPPGRPPAASPTDGIQPGPTQTPAGQGLGPAAPRAVEPGEAGLPGPTPPRPMPVAPSGHEPASQPRATPELPPLARPTEPGGPSPTAGGAAPATKPATPAPEPVITRSPAPVPSGPPTRKESVSPAPTVRTGQPSAAAAAIKYTIAENDSLWSIAEEYFGDGNLWPKIKAANPGLDENSLKVGQVILLPPKEETKSPAEPPKAVEKPSPTPAEPKPGVAPGGPAESKPPARMQTYVVEKDETLFAIAKKLLGNGGRWRELLELNKDKLSRPEDLKAGMELKVPPKGGEPTKTEPAKPETKKSGAGKKT